MLCKSAHFTQAEWKKGEKKHQGGGWTLENIENNVLNAHSQNKIVRKRAHIISFRRIYARHLRFNQFQHHSAGQLPVSLHRTRESMAIISNSTGSAPGTI